MIVAHSAPVGEVVERVRTWNPAGQPPHETFTYIDLSAVDQETKSVTAPRELRCAEAPSRARQLVSQGDVLVSTVRPNLNAVAVVPGTLDGATASTGFCVLRAQRTTLDGGYLFHWVKCPWFVGEMTRRATGASYPAVSDRIVHESLIPLPPLPEQRRIAAILDAADALRAKRRAAIAQLDTLAQSIFLDMFGDPKKNPFNWSTRPLAELCSSIFDIDHKMPPAEDNGIPIISAKDFVDDGTISFASAKRISEADYVRLSRKGKPRRGDILYSRYGTVGKARLVTTDTDFLASYSCCTIRPAPEAIDTLFLAHLLDSPFMLQQAMGQTRGSGIPDLGLKLIKQFSIILPPMQLQREFACRLSKVEDAKRTHVYSLTHLDELFASLQHRAFRGEL